MSGKTIQIDPQYLALANKRGKKQKTQKYNKKIKPQPPKQSNKMRKELLGRIKDFQKKKEENIAESHTHKESQKEEEDFQSEFNRSLSFLQNLSTRKNHKKNKKKKQTLKHPPSRTAIHTLSENPTLIGGHIETDKLKNAQLPSSQASEIFVSHPPQSASLQTNISIDAPVDMFNVKSDSSQLGKTVSNTLIMNPPPYGVLKNGAQPTFREWKNNVTRKKYPEKEEGIKLSITDQDNETLSDSAIVTTDIDDNLHFNVESVQNKEANIQPKEPSSVSTLPNALREEKLHEIKTQARAKANKISRIKTIKYRLGKLPNKRVGILIKNNTTRKRIQKEHGSLKGQNILEIKNYLRKKNLLKTGSNAPTDVLRQMYEQSILAGNIENTSNDNLMHNYFSTE